MADLSRTAVWWGQRGVIRLLLFWIIVELPPSLPQPPPPLSLPVHMSVIPHPWQFLPLSHAELGPLFSNSSPFSSSQSLFMVPPHSQAPRMGLQASFGPYSVTQLISEPVLPLSPPLCASLLSEHVEREWDERGQERFRVRTLFHKRGDTSTPGTCVTLHAFKETEEHKASCIPVPPLGLCVVTLTLPSDWFKYQHTSQTHQDMAKRHASVQPRRRLQKRERQRGRRHSYFSSRQGESSSSLKYHSGVDGDAMEDVPRAQKYQQGPMRDQIQLYYSSFDTVDDFELTQQGCVEDGVAPSQRKLFHIKAVTLKDEEKDRKDRITKEEGNCFNGQEKEELNLDSHVVIRYNRGLVLIGQSIKVSVNLRANISADLVVIRLKVKKGLVSMVAQRTLNSELWAVTLEKSQGSKHDMVSIFCHKQSTFKHAHNPPLLQQVVCLSIDGLRQSFGVAMAVPANWWVEYSGRSNILSPHRAAESVFSFADRHIFGIAPITESNTIINTAILTNQPISLPVIVLAISRDGKVLDVTSAVTCHSTNENTIKVSSDCSSLFVDGSESGLGNTCAMVEFLLGTLRGSVCLQVWAPSVPLRMSLADPVLNAIDGWIHFTEKGCAPVYQRSSIQVLTQFTAQDAGGRTKHLLGSSDWLVDVTDLVMNSLRIEDPRVASLDTQNNLIGLQPGKTNLYVISEQWDGVLGRCDVTVTSDPVTAEDLSVQVVSGLGISVTASPNHPSIITATVTAYNILYNQQQEASISIWLQFSDDTASLLSSFDDIRYYLRLSSLAETVVVVTPGPSQRIFAQGDGGGPLLRAELLVSTCIDQPITSNSISEGSRDWKDSEVEGRMRRLAKGSGWIRVNLDLGLMPPEGVSNEDSEEFVFDISDTLFESDGDIYVSNFDNDEVGPASEYEGRSNGKLTNTNWNKVGNSWMISQNNLERAVLMPSQKEGPVYFSPSQEKKVERKKHEEEEGYGAKEVDVGVGAVLSLLGLSALLFLANCLPCTLRDRRRTTQEKEEEEERERSIEDRGSQEGKETEVNRKTDGKKTGGEDEVKLQQEGDIQEDIKEVEIIC